MRSPRRILSLILAVIYVTSFVGYDLTVLTCHCLHHGAHACACCTRTADDGPGTFDSGRHCCTHDHSNTISLYEATTLGDFQRTHVATLPISYQHHATVTDDREATPAGIRNDESIPDPPLTRSFGLRAPPVLV